MKISWATFKPCAFWKVLVPTMRYLKRAWILYSELLTFEWLNRLWLKRPRLAIAIAGCLISLTSGFFAWYFLDLRFRHYEKDGYTEANWMFRIFAGVLLGTVALGVAGYTIISVKQGAPIILEGSVPKKSKANEELVKLHPYTSTFNP